MPIVDIEQAGGQLAQLIEAAAAGEDVVIARAGVPMARIVAVRTAATGEPRQLGLLAGKLGHIPDDFDDPLPEDVLAAFQGR
jgi:prevent-host-death family protein